MSFGRFVGAIAAVLFATIVLIWVFVSIAALIFALIQGEGGAAGIYALLVVGGVAVGALGWWIGRRVVKAQPDRH